jgi:hypothetical protein
LKKRKKAPTTWSHAIHPPFGGGGGVCVSSAFSTLVSSTGSVEGGDDPSLRLSGVAAAEAVMMKMN